MIAEIQFLLKFMLNAKKIGHSFYAFSRKQEFYNKLNKNACIGMRNGNGNDNGNDENINDQNQFLSSLQNMITPHIISKNDKNFEMILQYLNHYELQSIKDNINDIQMYIIEKLNENKWKKGEKIFYSLYLSMRDAFSFVVVFFDLFVQCICACFIINELIALIGGTCIMRFKASIESFTMG